MKIIHILSTNKYSGAENVAITIINQMKKNNDIVYISPDGTIRETLKENNIKFEPIKKMSVSEIKRVVKKYNPDVIHAHDIKASVLSSIFYKKNRRIISHIHGNHDKMKKISIKSIVFLLCAKRFNRIFWVSESAMKEFVFANKVKQNSQVLVNVIDINIINKKVLEDENEYFYDIIYLGRLSDVKNPLRVYKIMKNICLKNKKVQCVMVGDGDLKQNIEKKIIGDNMSENIILKGNMKNPMKILKSSKVMLMTSKYEGTPMCALEAMATGVPIVSTPTDGLVNLIKNHKNGFLSNNDNDLRLELEEIISNTKYRDILSRNIKSDFKKNNDIDKYIKIIEKEYKCGGI